MAFIELIGTETVAVAESIPGDLITNTVEALSGWYSTPSAKVESTSRQMGHGDFPVTSDMVLYATRTVTIELAALGKSRAEVLGIMERVNRLAGQLVKLRVSDGERDTYAVGYIEQEWAAARYANAATGTLTVVCADPRRYGWEGKGAALMPVTGTQGGVMFDQDTGNILTEPIQFHGETESGNTAVLTNDGTSTAYPVITVTGTWPDGVALTDGTGSLTYDAPLTGQALVLDCMSRTASIKSVDVTRNIGLRDFPSVEPGGSIRLSCLSAGSGMVGIELHDTYI